MESIAIKLESRGIQTLLPWVVLLRAKEDIRYRSALYANLCKLSLELNINLIRNFNKLYIFGMNETSLRRLRFRKYWTVSINRNVYYTKRVSRVQLLFNLRTSITRYRVTALRVSQPIAAQWIFIGRNSTARGKFIAQRDILLRRYIITRISLHGGLLRCLQRYGFMLHIRSNRGIIRWRWKRHCLIFA